MVGSSVPDLDAMTRAELRAFAARDRHDIVAEYFPKARGARVNAAKQLLTYARDKAEAMAYRAAGRIEAAREREWWCELDYRELPAWARWHRELTTAHAIEAAKGVDTLDAELGLTRRT